MLLLLQMSVIYNFFKYCSRFERGSNSPKPLPDESINPSDQVVNGNSSETSNFDNTANELPPQDSNDANKNKEHEYVCPLSIKLKEKYVSMETIYNEWFGLGTYTGIIPGGIYSLETLHPE